MKKPTAPVYLQTAETAITEAGKRIRAALLEHGDTERSFAMIAELWTIYLNHIIEHRGGAIEVLPHDVAQMMTTLKSVRSVYGKSDDNYVDQIGYTALAALLQQREEE